MQKNMMKPTTPTMIGTSGEEAAAYSYGKVDGCTPTVAK
jgi:hypothetical protein